MRANYDAAGWATKNDLLCSDGRTIRKDAFKEQDGAKVPLVWQHSHDNPENVLGHAILENRDEGVYAYLSFNPNERSQNALASLRHGDVDRLSIYANKLKQKGGDVLHGVIREVSLVLAGANPGATIETVLGHSEEFDEEAIICCGERIEEMQHSEENVTENIEDQTEEKNEEELQHEDKAAGEVGDGDETIEDVFNTLSEKQKKVVYAMIGMALESKGEGKDTKEDDNVKHNVFENDTRQRNVISHDDMKTIMADAKRLGSLKEAVLAHMENGVLAHATTVPQGVSGIDYSTGDQNYFVNQPSFLFPEYKSLNNPPEWIKRDTSWVQKVLGKVHHTPFSRIKSVFADITEDEARAKGYIKGNLKKDEVFTLLKRTTDPQTIYKRQKWDRDDLLDITDFDTVGWIRAEMRMMLDEEIARAILIGDGRLGSSDDHISEDHIRPVATDNALFTVKVPVVVPANATPADKAAALIDTAIASRKLYKGTGTPDFYTTEDMISAGLLLKDGIGHRFYKSEGELATAMRMASIVPVEVMENYTLDDDEVLGIAVNLADYNVGADKGGQVSMFDDFDIDYNQQKYLMETRCSGALVKPFSALVFVVEEE